MASKRRLRYKACARKTAFATHTAAKKAIDHWQPSEYVHIYKCDFGDHYHIGRPPKVKGRTHVRSKT